PGGAVVDEADALRGQGDRHGRRVGVPQDVRAALAQHPGSAAAVAGWDVVCRALDRDLRMRRAQQRGGALQLGRQIRLAIAAHERTDLGERGAGDLRRLPAVLGGAGIAALGRSSTEPPPRFPRPWAIASRVRPASAITTKVATRFPSTAAGIARAGWMPRVVPRKEPR